MALTEAPKSGSEIGELPAIPRALEVPEREVRQLFGERAALDGLRPVAERSVRELVAYSV